MNDRPIHHVCYVVDDIPKAVDQWVETTGAGPFFHLGEHVEFEETLLEGEPCVFDHASALGTWGPIFLELIQLHELTPQLASPVLHRPCRWQQHRPHCLPRRRPCRG